MQNFFAFHFFAFLIRLLVRSFCYPAKVFENRAILQQLAQQLLGHVLNG